ncbi:DUF1576 domain-containing protein [Sedimentibacter sp. zth1]|uniref:DUF1576 domain-containing protein n=1 Tax=Sedimentibacter sp. zth1 TaxID=2816908 RepID=UPI001A910653|nr:DUF1576 domain-containing protein [Sedimentibacter sp. zth1]QSX05163.1 DUF1576 domain-containing protein [Sedimentibacter sp. zth1]
MQLNNIVEKKIGRNNALLILSVFPVSILLCCIILWILDSQINYKTILTGLANIIFTPTILITDFLEVGGISSAMINAALIGFLNLFFLKKCKLKINGLLIAAFLTVFGFSFFGINIYNIIPIYVGGFLYSKYQNIKFKSIILSVILGTGLSPVISQISFSGIMPMYFSIPLGILSGIFIGFVIVPLASHMLRFHDGYNIYNIGFTAGILGTVLTSFLRSLNIEIVSVNILYKQKNYVLFLVLLLQFIFLIIVGFIINKKSIINYKKILKYKGRIVTDFTFLVGYGTTFLNMGILGILSLTFVYITGGIINGPVIAAIFSVAGFGAFGKHLANCLPICLGTLLWAYLLKFDISSTSVIITVLFSTTIAPVAGTFGPLIGILAGVLHFTIASNIGIIHGGLNLYNNGFAGGLVAGFLVPIIEAFKRGEK